MTSFCAFAGGEDSRRQQHRPSRKWQLTCAPSPQKMYVAVANDRARVAPPPSRLSWHGLHTMARRKG